MYHGDEKVVMQTTDKTKLLVADLHAQRLESWVLDGGGDGSNFVQDLSRDSDKFGIVAIAPETKSDFLGCGDVLSGVNSRGVFFIDGRLSGAKVVMESSKTYSKDVGLSCIATSNDGWQPWRWRTSHPQRTPSSGARRARFGRSARSGSSGPRRSSRALGVGFC